MMVWIAMLILIAFSAFFSSFEIALTSLNRMRLEKLAQEGRGSVRLAVKIEDRYETSLSTILVGNNIVNTAASSVMTTVTLAFFGGNEALGGIVATAAVTVLLLIFGEIIPKMIGKRLAIPLTCLCAYPFAFLMILLRPVTWIVGGIVFLVSRIWRRGDAPDKNKVTEDELANIIETVEEEGVIDEDKGELLQSALDFSDITVESILTPRVDVTAIDIHDDIHDIFDELLEAKYSRFPIYEDSIDHITGIFYLTPFLKEVAENGLETVDISKYVMETIYVHKTTKLPDALAKMRDNKLHMIVVLDEYGGTLGIVTMEDILEEIVGDIWDETDDIELSIVPTSPNTYEVLRTTNIEDFFDEIDFPYDDFESEYTTMGGWAVEMLNEDPHEGDSFTYKNLYIEVSAMGDNLVEKLTVLVMPKEEADAAEDRA